MKLGIWSLHQTLPDEFTFLYLGTMRPPLYLLPVTPQNKRSAVVWRQQQTSVTRVPHKIRQSEFQEANEGCLAVYAQCFFVMHIFIHTQCVPLF